MPRLQDTIDISYPLFLKKADADVNANSISIPISMLVSGNGLYGDHGKTQGFKAASVIAERDNMAPLLLDFRVKLNGDEKGNQRIDEEKLKTISFVNISSMAMLKKEARVEIERVLQSAIDEKYGNRAGTHDVQKWLFLDPALTSALFKEYPNLLFVVISTQCIRLDSLQLPVVFFRDAKTVLRCAKINPLKVRFRPDISITIDQSI